MIIFEASWSEMSPRERDYLIAAEVMRLNVDYWNWPHGQGPMIVMGESPNMKALTEVPHYSTDIAAAWEVVEKLGHHWDIEKGNDNEKEYVVYHSNIDEQWKAKADTAPEAICLAAFKALNIDI